MFVSKTRNISVRKLDSFTCQNYSPEIRDSHETTPDFCKPPCRTRCGASGCSSQSLRENTSVPTSKVETNYSYQNKGPIFNKSLQKGCSTSWGLYPDVPCMEITIQDSIEVARLKIRPRPSKRYMIAVHYR